MSASKIVSEVVSVKVSTAVTATQGRQLWSMCRWSKRVPGWLRWCSLIDPKASVIPTDHARLPVQRHRRIDLAGILGHAREDPEGLAGGEGWDVGRRDAPPAGEGAAPSPKNVEFFAWNGIFWCWKLWKVTKSGDNLSPTPNSGDSSPSPVIYALVEWLQFWGAWLRDRGLGRGQPPPWRKFEFFAWNGIFNLFTGA